MAEEKIIIIPDESTKFIYPESQSQQQQTQPQTQPQLSLFQYQPMFYINQQPYSDVISSVVNALLLPLVLPLLIVNSINAIVFQAIRGSMLLSQPILSPSPMLTAPVMPTPTPTSIPSTPTAVTHPQTVEQEFVRDESGRIVKIIERRY